MLHPLGTDQLIRQAFNLGGGAADYDNFQTMVGVEVNMQRRDDGIVV